MTAVSELYNSLRVELPGIPEPLLVDGVLRTLQDFFQRSEAWRHTVPNLKDWTATTPTFPVLVVGVDIPANTRVSRTDVVKYSSDGISLKEVIFKTRQQLDKELSNWEIKTGNTPVAWINDGPNNPRLIPIANATVTASLQIRVVVSPAAALTDIPDTLFFEFQDHFRNGTLARLMKIPGKDWTNFSASAAYAALFKVGLKEAKSRADAEYGQPCREVMYGGL